MIYSVHLPDSYCPAHTEVRVHGTKLKGVTTVDTKAKMVTMERDSGEGLTTRKLSGVRVTHTGGDDCPKCRILRARERVRRARASERASPSLRSSVAETIESVNAFARAVGDAQVKVGGRDTERPNGDLKRRVACAWRIVRGVPMDSRERTDVARSLYPNVLLSYEDEISGLERNRAEWQETHNAQLAEVRRQREAWREEYKRSERAASALRCDLQKAAEDRALLECDAARHANARKYLNKRVIELAQESSGLRTEAKGAKFERDGLRNEVASLLESHGKRESELATLQSVNETLREANRARDGRISDLEADVRNLEHLRLIAEHESDRMRRRFGRLDRAITYVSASLEDVDETMTDVMKFVASQWRLVLVALALSTFVWLAVESHEQHARIVQTRGDAAINAHRIRENQGSISRLIEAVDGISDTLLGKRGENPTSR